MPGKLSGKNIAIVGGGFTGLTAALQDESIRSTGDNF